MFAVVVKLNIHPDKMAVFLPLVRANASASVQNEPDCHQFDVATDPARPGDVFLYELYSDAAGFEYHKTTSHFISFDRETADMIADKDVATYAKVEQ